MTKKSSTNKCRSKCNEYLISTNPNSGNRCVCVCVCVCDWDQLARHKHGNRCVCLCVCVCDWDQLTRHKHWVQRCVCVCVCVCLCECLCVCLWVNVIETSLPGSSIQWAVGISHYSPLPLTQQSVEWSILFSDHAVPVLIPNMGGKIIQGFYIFLLQEVSGIAFPSV